MSDLDSDDEPKKKSTFQKDENHILRQEQIQMYKSQVLKEQREYRMKLRHGLLEESPRKKKRVSFHVDKAMCVLGDLEDISESEDAMTPKESKNEVLRTRLKDKNQLDSKTILPYMEDLAYINGLGGNPDVDDYTEVGQDDRYTDGGQLNGVDHTEFTRKTLKGKTGAYREMEHHISA